MTPETTFFLQDVALYCAMLIFGIGLFVCGCAAMEAYYKGTR